MNIETVNTEIESLVAELKEPEGKGFRKLERLTFLTRCRDKPEYLKEGRYELTEEVDNPLGDARSNGAHWRGALEKKLPIPAGFRFEVSEDGTIKEGRSSVHWFLYEDDKNADKTELRSNKRGRDFIEALMKAAKPVEASLEEEFAEHCGGYGGNGLRVFKAALNLGVDKAALFAEVNRLLEETDD